MKFKIVFLSLLTLILLQGNSCENQFSGNQRSLSSNQQWWNDLSSTWKELCLRETGHSGEKINQDILIEILALESFEVDYYPIGGEGLKPLIKLVHLKEISAGNTQIKKLSPLTQFQELRYLNIPSTPVHDLTPLANLKNLEELYVQQSQISDLSPLSGLSNLQILMIHETNVSSLEAIMSLNELSILSIGETNIKQSEIDEFIKLHPNCEINQ